MFYNLKFLSLECNVTTNLSRHVNYISFVFLSLFFLTQSQVPLVLTFVVQASLSQMSGDPRTMKSTNAVWVGGLHSFVVCFSCFTGKSPNVISWCFLPGQFCTAGSPHPFLESSAWLSMAGVSLVRTERWHWPSVHIHTAPLFNVITPLSLPLLP